MAKTSKQATPEKNREFTFTEIRAANIARIPHIEPGWESIRTDQRAKMAIGMLERIPEAVNVDEPTDPLIVERLAVQAFLELDLMCWKLGINLNQAVPMIFNDESQRRKIDIELDYIEPDDGG